MVFYEVILSDVRAENGPFYGSSEARNDAIIWNITITADITG